MIKELKQKLVKDTIIAETKKQFLEKGIQKTTLRGIAKELQIAFGNIYYYFKSKLDICDILWVEYTNGFLDQFVEKTDTDNSKASTGLEKLRLYYTDLFEYFEENPLYAELIAFSMGEKPRYLRAAKENKEPVRAARSRLQNTLIGIYKEGINDGSIATEISNVFFESWSFNISFVAIVINIIRYQEISIDVYEYYVNTYLNRLAKLGEKMRLKLKTNSIERVFTAIIILIVTPVLSTVIEVPDEYSTIQAGIDAAFTGDTVLVATGTYFENINFKGKNILLTSHYLYEYETQYINSTIIDGSNFGNADSASTVTICSGESESAVLQGFTITGGGGTAWIDPQYPNSTWYSGGGIIILYASPTIRNNIITSNIVINDGSYDGASGGGLLCFRGNPLIINNHFTINQADYGAGLVVDFSGARIRNNIVAYNSGGQLYGGGGLYCIGTDTEPILLENNVIYGNYSQTTGGAIRLWTSSVTAKNNIIWSNTQNSGGQINGNSINITYSNIEGGFNGEGNINSDPLFSDFMTYQISEDSPCVDTGDPGSAFFDPENPNSSGQARYPSLGGVRNDMGAYGGPYTENWNFTSTNDELPDQGSIPFNNLKAYPNPFNPKTEISFQMTGVSDENIELGIYNLRCQKVKHFSISNIQYPLSNNQFYIIWDGTDNGNQPVPSGVYFYTLSSGQYSQSKKMMLLK